MEAHTLSSVLITDTTFPSEKYCTNSKKNFRKKEDMFKIKNTKNRELQSLNFPDTNFRIKTRNSVETRFSSLEIDEQKPATRFKGREVVLVDPLDESADYWWPAMVVPPTEIDRSMLSRKLERDECLVRYFEDNKFSVCKDSELTPFRPDTHPLNEFSQSSAFLNDPGVLIALNYLRTGELGKKFMWKLWGKDKDVPPVATSSDNSQPDQEKSRPQDTVPKPATPQKKPLQEQQKTSTRKRKKAPCDEESEIGANHVANEISHPSKRNPSKSNACEKRKHIRNPRVKQKKSTPTSSRAPSEDAQLSMDKPSVDPEVESKSQPDNICQIPVKEIVRRMKALRKEYKRIQRGVRRVAKELVIHKAGDGRITRSMMRRKK